MKAENQYFMACVDLNGALIDIEKAIKALEDNIPQGAFNRCQMAIKELLSCMDQIHKRALVMQDWTRLEE
jgi:hypothetical protein